MRSQPSILHMDLDAFFAAVEQRDKPSLRGKPVVVGGTGWRGVVSTASYEARAFGIGSAMPTGEARRRHPHAAYLGTRFAAYKTASEQVMALLREASPLVEQVSLDEAYIDLTPRYPELDVGAVTEVAQGLRATIQATTGLTASVGAGTSKLVAKIGSDLDKPDGLTVVAPGDEAATLAPMPVRRLPGVGEVTAERLRRHGLMTIGDLAGSDVVDLVSLLGHAHGHGLLAYAHGIDPRPVVPEREAKSVSSETTFEQDVSDRRQLGDHLLRLAGRTADRLAMQRVSGRTVTIKIRRYDFSTMTRSVTLPRATDDVREILDAATGLLTAVDVADGLRLLGVGVTGLTEFAQQDLLAGLGAAEPADGTTITVPTDHPVPPTPMADGDPVTEHAETVRTWFPGQDVRHGEHGAGWVQGSGSGRVTVRFEGPHTAPGPIRTLVVSDPELEAAEPPTW